MSTRFETLFELPKELYCDESPVIVSAGVLLKDTESKRLVAQLKFRNISPNTIRALGVTLSIADTAGRHIATLPEYQYLDLSVHNEWEFGSNKAILIPNPTARSFTVSRLSVVFSDGTVWKSEAALSPLPQTVTLLEALVDSELVKQYQLAANTSAKYVPYTSMGLHKCTCGKYHRKAFCSACGLNYEQAQAAYDIPVLTAAMKERIAAETAAREEQLAKDKAAREAAKRARDYMKAQELKLRAKNAKTYGKAEALFLALGDYRDSAELAAECHERMMQLTIEKLETTKSDKDYKEAEAILLSAAGDGDNAEAAQQYRDAYTSRKQEQSLKRKKTIKRICIAVAVIAIVIAMVPVTQTYIIPAVKYSQAEKLAQEAQYDEAIAVFMELGEYKDAQTRVWETTYSKAMSLMENGQFTEAADIFKDLHGYADSRERIKECAYLYGAELMSKKQFGEAIGQLLAADGFEDADALLKECYLTMGEAEYIAQNYESALAYYQKVDNLDPAHELYRQCVYQVALIKLANGQFKEAVSMFAEVIDLEDSLQKRLEAMYAYVTANKTNSDSTTYEYLTELKETGYEDSQSVYNEIYSWGVATLANYSSSDTTTDNSTLSGTRTCYIHFTITGGEPDAKLPVHAKIKYPNGTSQTFEFGEMAGGDHNYVYFNSWGNYAKGNCTLTIYNSDTNKSIGSHTIKLS